MNPQILAIALAVVMLVVVILLLRFYFLPEKYAVLWLVAAVVAIVFAVFPRLLDGIASLLGVAVPINLLFFAGFFIVLLLLMQLTLELARTRDELRKVIQRIAVDLEEKKDKSDTTP